MKNIFVLLFLLMAGFLQAQPSLPSYLPSNGLIGWWPFNGNANDESGNGLNGTVNGAMLTADRFGNVNRAYVFSQTSSEIILENSEPLNFAIANFSISAWVNIDSVYCCARILSKGSNTMVLSTCSPMGSLNSDKLGFGFDTYGKCYGVVPNIAERKRWVHIVCIKTSLGYTYYLDKVKYTSNFNQDNNPISDLTSKIIIGPNIFYQTSENYFIDDIAFYNRALTEDEVTALYDAVPDFCIADIINKDTSICRGAGVKLTATSSFSGSTVEGIIDVKDKDGNTYPTVKIGTQLWMQENLRTTKYSDGSNIPVVTDINQWIDNYNSKIDLPMMCWYNNDKSTFTANKMGALYNWFTINPGNNGNKNLCPSGWHVPSDDDWNTLINYLDPGADGGLNDNTAGGQMKSTLYWESPNGGATNSSGFSGFPGGFRYGANYGTFSGVGYAGFWWSSNEGNPFSSSYQNLSYFSGKINGGLNNKNFGYSVRCLRDNFLTYLWSTGATTQTIDVSPTETTKYYVTVSNGINSCTDSITIYVNQPSASTTNLSVCPNQLPYSWNGQALTSAGTYTVTLTSVSGCDSIATLVLTINSVPQIQLSSSPILCNGGTGVITVSAIGGTAPYTGTGTFSRTGGDHRFTITDAKGCSSSGDITLFEPSLLTATTTTTSALRLSNGTATVYAFGGTPAYSYRWNTNPVQTTTTATGLPAGTYFVVVTDANSCTVNVSATIVSSVGTDCSTAFRTVSQGGWGSPARGDNPGIYLNSNFAKAFPEGLSIGSCNRNIILNSAEAVRNFLPSGGTPRQLNSGTLLNPKRSDYSNTFAGQLVALALNLRFDSVDASFGLGGSLLRDATISDGIYRGWTVQQLYNEANNIIGCGADKSIISNLTDAMDRINNSWEDGNRSNEYIDCPVTNGVVSPPVTVNTLTDANKIMVYPNPTNDRATVKYRMRMAGRARIMLYNPLGVVVLDQSVQHPAEGEYTFELKLKSLGLSSGTYMMRMERNGEVNSSRVVLVR